MKSLIWIILIFVLTKVFSIEIIGHRGSPFEAEENTIASFKKAFEQGADGIECDFWLTQDDRIICSHDPIRGDINLCKTCLEEIKRFYPLMPTLEEVLEIVPPDRKVYIEIKRGAEIVPHLERILSQCSLPKSQITLLSFELDVVLELRKKMPSYNTYYSIAFFPLNQRPHQIGKKMSELYEQVISLNVNGLCLEGLQEQITEMLSLQQKPLPWVVWTVDEKEEARKFEQMGAIGIITNYPLKIKEEFGS